jgi:hypothetical protein
MATYAAGYTGHWDASDTDRLWTNAAFSIHPTDGQEIYAWDDEADEFDSAFFDQVGAGGIVPVYRAAAFNGLGCLDFDGTNDYLSLFDDTGTTEHTIGGVITSTAYTVFISVMMEGDAPNSSDTFGNDLIIGDRNAFFGLYVKTNAGVNTLMAYNWDGSDDHADVTISQNTAYVAMFRHESGNLYLSVNQGSESSTASGTTTDTVGTLRLGATGVPPPTNFFNGKIGEILMYNTALSGSNLTDTYQYLMDRWVTAAGSPSVRPSYVGFPKFLLRRAS